VLLEQVASRLNTPLEQLERDSLHIYLQRKLRTIESEIFTLAHRYGVRTVFDMDEAIQSGKLHEPESFEDYFRFDYLEDQRDTLRELLNQI
jgi:hypothetical protein